MSMVHSTNSTRLSHEGVLAALNAAVAAAHEIGVAQCIVIVDVSGVMLGALRMDSARFLSLRTARRKAITAASNRVPTEDMEGTRPLQLGTATNGDFIALQGGLPIFIGGEPVGAVGVGSGSGEQDIFVARAALGAIDGASETP